MDHSPKLRFSFNSRTASPIASARPNLPDARVDGARRLRQPTPNRRANPPREIDDALLITMDSALEAFDVGTDLGLSRLATYVSVDTRGPQFAAGRVEDNVLARPDLIWGDLIKRGVTAIQTDHPDQLIAYLRVIGRR